MRTSLLVVVAVALLGAGFGTVVDRATSAPPGVRTVTFAAPANGELVNEVKALSAAEARLAALPGTGTELAAVNTRLGALQRQLAGSSNQAVTAVERPAITVVGIGQVRDAPDVLTLSVGVHVENSSAPAALATADAGARNVIDALKSGGVAPADIQTAFVRFGRAFPEDRGYVVDNEVTARLRNMSRAAAVIGAAAQAGGRDTQGWGVTFDLQDNGRQLAAARARAMADAHTQAAELARLAGRSLASVRTINEGVNTPPGSVTCCPSGAATAGGSAPAIPIQPGSQTVVAVVTVTYDLG